MISALYAGSKGLGSSPKLCSWTRHFTLIVLLSTPVYKWELTNLVLGLTLQWTSTDPIQGQEEKLLVASCYGCRGKVRSDEPLGLNAYL